MNRDEKSNKKFAIKWVSYGRGTFALAPHTDCITSGAQRTRTHCGFASAHFIRAAPIWSKSIEATARTLPQHTSYGLHRKGHYLTDGAQTFASAHFIWAAPSMAAARPLLSTLCLSTLPLGCTGKTAQRHGYSIVKCAVSG